MKKICTFIITLFAVIGCALGVFGINAAAEDSSDEITQMNQIMTISVDCTAKEEPDENATSVMEYTAGASVWITGETKNGWYKVSYQGKEGFIHKDNVTGMQVESEDGGMVELGETNLDAEMAAMEAEGEMLVEEIERQRSEKKQSNIWIIVIGVLIAGIFATGIISTVKSNGNKKEEKDNE